MTPQFFVDLASSFRDFCDNYQPNTLLIHQSTPDEFGLLRHVGPKFRGPARWIALNKDGWDDVDIAHVIRASYELYRDPRLNIGDNPHHGYEGGKWVGKDDTGESYGRFDTALWLTPLE